MFSGKVKYIKLAICLICCNLLCYKLFIQPYKGIMNAVLKALAFGVRYNDN
jgi:hypothetical protein